MRRLISLVLLVAFLVSTAAADPGKGKGKGHDKWKDEWKKEWKDGWHGPPPWSRGKANGHYKHGDWRPPIYGPAPYLPPLPPPPPPSPAFYSERWQSGYEDLPPPPPAPWR
jgi:hypothetical protein